MVLTKNKKCHMCNNESIEIHNKCNYPRYMNCKGTTVKTNVSLVCVCVCAHAHVRQFCDVHVSITTQDIQCIEMAPDPGNL